MNLLLVGEVQWSSNADLYQNIACYTSYTKSDKKKNVVMNEWMLQLQDAT